MRQVTKESTLADENVKAITEVDCCRYYGILRDGDKGFVTADSFHGYFKVVMSRGMTYANGLGFKDEELGKMLYHVLKKQIEVFEFDTPEQLCAWLAGVRADTPPLRRVVEKAGGKAYIGAVDTRRYYGTDGKEHGGGRGVLHAVDITGMRRFVTNHELKIAISESMNHSDIYEFDTLAELFIWIAKDPTRQ